MALKNRERAGNSIGVLLVNPEAIIYNPLSCFSSSLSSGPSPTPKSQDLHPTNRLTDPPPWLRLQPRISCLGRHFAVSVRPVHLGAKHAASRATIDNNSNSKASSVYRRIVQGMEGMPTGPRIPDEAGRRLFLSPRNHDRCLSRPYGPAHLVGGVCLADDSWIWKARCINL